MLGDFLRDSPIYQEVLEEGVEKGRLEERRQALLDIVFERFPEITHLARQQAMAIDDLEILRHLTVKMSTVQTPEQATQYLLAATRDGHMN